MTEEQDQSTSPTSEVEGGEAAQTIPSRQDTEKALDGIKEQNVTAGTALRHLAEGMLKLVAEIDMSCNLSEYLNKCTVVCHGEGHFALEIDDKDTGVDTDELAQQLIEELSKPEKEYGKQMRPIALNEVPDGRAQSGNR